MAMPAFPSGWGSFNAQQKMQWFNDNGVTVNDLAEAGVDTPTIEWMVVNGFKPGGVSLPTDWFSKNGQQKVDWFVQNRITQQQLQQQRKSHNIEFGFKSLKLFYG